MASTYSTNLALELIGTGDQAGTWGNTTNTNLGTLIEQAVSGYVTQAVATGTDTTITIPNGATGVARNMYIELTGTGGTNTNLIVPANKKIYFIYNNSTGAVTVKVSGQTGVSVAVGQKKILASNGTDVVEATTYLQSVAGSATLTTLTATSATITSLANTTLSSASATVTNISSTSATISTLVQPKFTSYRETVVTNASAGGTISIDLSQGNVFNLTLTSSGSLVISNPPASGTSFSFTVICLQGAGGSKLLTYPASVKFTDSVTPVLTTTAGKYDVLTFFTVDGGTTYFGAYAMANL